MVPHVVGDVRAGGEVVESFAEIGVLAFTTGRAVGSFGLLTDEPVREVTDRWTALRRQLGGTSARLATASQVHGACVLEHSGGWQGWLRAGAADGHIAAQPGTSMAVTVADCVPVFIAHPAGATAVLHSGWRGTAAGITEAAIVRLSALGLHRAELRLHCGPAICGSCYEVSADVQAQLGVPVTDTPSGVDLRSIIFDRAHALGVRRLSRSSLCTKCDNDRFYSHRAGDAGRQLGVISSMGMAANLT